MRTPDFRSFLDRLSQSKMVAKVAEELGGPGAQSDLLIEAGYAGQPDGLATRLAVDLEKALPLSLDPATVQAYGGYFNGTETMAACRREAEEMLTSHPATDPDPSSQLYLSSEEIQQKWTWISGTKSLRLARAWRLTADPKMALACSRSLERFCRHNPPLMGWGWLDSSHLAVRAVNWLMALRFIGDLAVLKSEAVVLILLQLKVIGQVLAQELEDKEQGFGPRDAALAGALLYLGRCLSFFADSPAWWTLGHTLLGPAIGSFSQFMPLSGPVATETARRAADFGGLGLWLARHSGVVLPGLEEGLKPLARFCRAAAPPWGAGLSWGWEPGGPLMGLDHGGVDSFSQACNLAAVLLGDPDLRTGRDLDERMYWLFGAGISEHLRRLAGGKDVGSLDLPAAGLSLLAVQSQGRKVSLWLRTAPRYASSSPGVTADALSLGLVLNGSPVLVTPGPAGSGPLAPYLKSRSAFNSIIIDGSEPQKGQVTLEGLEADNRQGFCVARFDGYAHLEDPVELKRRIFLDGSAGIINIVDQIKSSGEHTCELFFHLPPGSKVERDERGSLLLRGEFGQAWLRPEQQAEIKVATGRSNPPMGWLAVAPGEVNPAPVVTIRLGVAGNARVTTTIALDA